MEQRSISWIAKDLVNGFSGVVRGEMQLAKAELSEGARDAAKQVAKVAVAGVIAVLGGLSLLAFAVIGLGELLGGNYWLSALIVGLVFLIPGAFLAISAARNIRMDVSFSETRESVQEDTRFLNEKVRSIRRVQREELSANRISGLSAVSTPEEGPEHRIRTSSY